MSVLGSKALPMAFLMVSMMLQVQLVAQYLTCSSYLYGRRLFQSRRDLRIYHVAPERVAHRVVIMKWGRLHLSASSYGVCMSRQ